MKATTNCLYFTSAFNFDFFGTDDSFYISSVTEDFQGFKLVAVGIGSVI